jgi:hypothetical protein
MFINRLQTEIFCSMFETSQSLFWASFGLVDLVSFELAGIKSFTRFWALLMFGSYSVINIIVLLNMLIAMMSNSYQIISVSVTLQKNTFSLYLSQISGAIRRRVEVRSQQIVDQLLRGGRHRAAAF